MVSVLAKPPSRIEPAVLELPWSSRASRFTLLRELKLAQECKGCVETLCKGCHGTEHPKNGREPGAPGKSQCASNGMLTSAIVRDLPAVYTHFFTATAADSPRIGLPPSTSTPSTFPFAEMDNRKRTVPPMLSRFNVSG